MADNLDDVLNSFSEWSPQFEDFQREVSFYLETINENILNLSKSSQTNASRAFRDRYDEVRDSRDEGNHGRYNSKSRKGYKGVLEGFEAGLLEAVLGSDWSDRINDSLEKFADTMNVSVEELSGEIGKKLSESAMNALKNSRFSGVFDDLSNITDGIFTKGSDAINSSLEALASGDLKSAVGSLTGGLKAMAPELIAAAPYVAAITAALIVLSPILDAVADVVGDVVAVFKALSLSANRYENSRKEMVKNAQERIRQDVETLVKYPFEILQRSAEEVEKAWDSAIKVINATQGYDKSGLQDLMSTFAQRLRDEGLSSVVSGTDIITNLEKVLQSGLSGKAAEEFAYQATLLSEAIPTQDFFSFADSYASMAANAIRSGKSQQEALEMANNQLKEFANNLLYSSRQLSGGFSTGLKNASDLFSQTVKIATAAGSTNYEQISSVLLGIAGEVGSVAPDLVSGLVDAVYRASTGGNSADITALRSMAGTGASNTEFLRAFVNNPQKIFSNIFNKLANIYQESNDAFMERAEALAPVFGLSAEAFQRVDFTRLADAIQNMDLSNSNLEQNMQLLQSGQTKTTEEQLKAAQINKYMIEEGLSYVLDNEAARSIQEHLWQEQMKNELMEATYAVELGNSTMKLFEDIGSLIRMIVRIINPASWFNSFSNIDETLMEIKEQRKDLKQMLELGKVGEGNQKDLASLVTVGVNQHLTESLVELMGGKSNYVTGLNSYNQFVRNNAFIGTDRMSRFSAYGDNYINNMYKTGWNNLTSSQSTVSSPSSRYTWSNAGSVSKSNANALSSLMSAASKVDETYSILDRATSAVSSTASVAVDRVSQMLEQSYMIDEFVKQGKSFDEWKESGSRFGITDMSEALTTAGYDEDKLERYYNEQGAAYGGDILGGYYEDEQDFRDKGRSFWGEYFPNEYNTPIQEMFTTANTYFDTFQNWANVFEERFFTQYSDPLQMILTQANTSLLDIIQHQDDWMTYFTEQWVDTIWNKDFVGTEGLFRNFFDEFVNYFVKHTYYDTYYDSTDVQRIQKMESDNSEDANFALAEALTKNINDLTDPTMQTNALLAQILIIVSAIQNQNNNVAGLSLPDTLSSLAMGLTNQTQNEVASTV